MPEQRKRLSNENVLCNSMRETFSGRSSGMSGVYLLPAYNSPALPPMLTR